MVSLFIQAIYGFSLIAGRTDPIPFRIKRDLTGLGKTSQDVRMIETTVAQRRGMDSERQRKENENQRRAREVHLVDSSRSLRLIWLTEPCGSKIGPRKRAFDDTASILLHSM
jgi:hypothetical protein